jgi:hypothetical protein
LESELMAAHVDLAAAECHTFCFKPEPLFDGGVSAQLDLSTCTEHPMPGQIQRTVQGAYNLSRRAGKSRSPRNGSIGGNPPPRDLPNGC